MRKLVTVIFLFHFTVVSGQSYYPLLRQDVYWDVFHYDGLFICNLSDASRYFLDGDTLINGNDYKIIKYHPIISLLPQPSPFCWPFGVDGNSTNNSNYFIREDTTFQKVYVWVNNQEYLLYDFSIQVGDTINSNYHVYPFVIDSIGSYLMPDGTSRRIFYGSPSADVEFYIEGVGSSTGLFNPFSWAISAGYRLSCVLENNIPIYSDSIFSFGCLVFVGLNEIPIFPKIDIFPNPASDKLNIKVANNTAGLFKLIDITGRIIYETFIFHNTKQIELGLFEKGIYFYQFESLDKLTLSGKIIVQN